MTKTFLFGLLALLAFAQNAQAQSGPVGFEDMADKLLPTVVNVSTTTKIETPGLQGQLPQMPALPPGSPFEDFFREFYDRYQQGIPGSPQEDHKVSALGSGFVIDSEKGYIVTNNHVIKDADEIRIILHDDTALDAKLIGTDDKTDLAVLQVTPTKALTAAKWGDSDTARVGSWVVAIGNPFGLGGTVTAGIVSARQRDINAGPYDDFIQTDASINRGNSGGPMFNAKGEVIGVNTAIFSPSGGSVGIGFAVPSNIARNVVDQLIAFGKTKRGWLGVRIQEVTDDMAASFGMDKASGALVSSVTPGGPAEKAGILAGDIILSFDSKPVANSRSLPRIVAETDVGKKVSVNIWRKKKQLSLTAELGQLEEAEESGLIGQPGPAAPGPAPKTTDIKPLGLAVSVLNDSLRAQYNLPQTAKGVIVTDVTRKGPAAEKGIVQGDLILEIDQQEAASPEVLTQKVQEAQKKQRTTVLLFVERNNNRRFVAIKLGKE